MQDMIERFDTQEAPLTDRELTRKLKSDLRSETNAEGYKLMIEEIRLSKAVHRSAPTGRILLEQMYTG